MFWSPWAKQHLTNPVMSKGCEMKKHWLLQAENGSVHRSFINITRNNKDCIYDTIYCHCWNFLLLLLKKTWCIYVMSHYNSWEWWLLKLLNVKIIKMIKNVVRPSLNLVGIKWSSAIVFYNVGSWWHRWSGSDWFPLH